MRFLKPPDRDAGYWLNAVSLLGCSMFRNDYGRLWVHNQGIIV